MHETVGGNSEAAHQEDRRKCLKGIVVFSFNNSADANQRLGMACTRLR